MVLYCVQEEVFNDSLKAAEYIHQILDIDPMDSAALDKLADIYEANEAWDDLIQALDRHVEVTESGDQKISLLVRIADVYETKCDDLDNAIGKTVAELAPHKIVSGKVIKAYSYFPAEDEVLISPQARFFVSSGLYVGADGYTYLDIVEQQGTLFIS